ncbi:glycerophosphocholine cholinephosphodiesterase ENPP6-like [Penaeus indicus]|uniref:glycerophosphocholine cholinephosphodiesterase ENPP6-like n=1 Tax=Penaeus indicus TaxID=29960 RepID=UPI00300D99F1
MEASKVFSLYDLEGVKDPAWWSDAEPFWITATKSSLQTALFLWSRCDVPWDGDVLPSHCDPFRFTAPNTDNMVRNFRQAVDMIQNQGYSLAMVYDGIIDTQGHYFGPVSSEVAAAVRETDTALQQLWKDLSDRDMIDEVNVVLVSDHGMTWTGQRMLQELDVVACLDESQVVKVVEYGGYISIQPRAGYAEEVTESLRRCPTVGENVNVFLKEDVPEAFHYRAHRLILEIVVIAKEGYMIRPPQTTYSVPETAGSYEGNHGFDNTNGRNPDMRAVLYAVGPYFAQGVRAGVVEQVDVYNLLCRSLQLQCHANNGTLAHVEPFFRPGIPLESGTSFKHMGTLGALMLAVSALIFL